MNRPDDETLARLYVEQCMSLAEIGRLYGKHRNQIRRWLIQASIPVRSIREGTILSGKYGVHSDEHREKLRENAAKARAAVTSESRKKQSATRIARGIPAPNKGVPMSEEQRQKLIELRADPEYRRIQSERFRGEKSPNWKGGVKTELARRLDTAGWRRTRLVVYERDGWMCQDCGERCLNTKDSKKNPRRKIQCHHIISRRNGGSDELDNLVTLCMSCHHRRERKEAHTKE